MSKQGGSLLKKRQQAASLLASNNLSGAKALFEKIVAKAPDDVDSWMNLAMIYSRTGRLGEVERCCRGVIRLRPDIVDVHFNLGVALYLQGKVDESIQSFRQALKLRPNHMLALYNMGKALFTRRQLGDALSCQLRVLQIKPGPADRLPQEFFATVHHAIASVLKSQGRLKEAVSHYRQALNLEPGLAKAHADLLYTLNCDLNDPQTVFEEHVRWGTQHAPARLPADPYPNTRIEDRPLRVGYVSPDLYQHAVACFFESLLANHDRSMIVPICYAEAWKQDGMTEHLRSMSELWRNTCDSSDEQLASQIRADGIDILVDLAGHTAQSRLTLFSKKPAPIQVSYLGYPNTTGLTTIDYRLTDAIADPPGMTDQFYTEKLFRLPRTFLCYQPPEYVGAAAVPPSLSTGHVTFGCFNNLAKFNSATIELWCNILKAVPDSRMVLKNLFLGDLPTQDLVRQEFAKYGVSGGRVELRGPVRATAAHQATYNEIDIALDPYPYNGTTTTCDAVWMGVPVITLAGNTHAGRVGASILAQVGLTECIADTPGEYFEIAVRLANDSDRLVELHAGLRDRMTRSPLMDAPGFARDVEDAYHAMWRAWCNS